MRLLELFGRAGLECPSDAENIEITNIVTDSREVVKGSLFICLKGLSSDGHKYVDDAINAGAAVIVAERVRDVCVGGAAAIILLDNTRRVAALLYNAWYGNPTKKLKIIGVTGTNGKTSVTTLAYEIFTGFGLRAGLIGTVCRLSADGRSLSHEFCKEKGHMTTPDPEELYKALALMADDGVEYVFMEVSSHALALCKTDAIEFDLAVFTNLTQDHLDFHGSMEEYYLAKKKLFSMSRRALIWTDGEYGKRLALECDCPVMTVSAHDGDFCALDVKRLADGGSEYTLKYPEGTSNVRISLVGRFFVENSLTSAAIALLYKIPKDVVIRSLGTSRGVRGRMERVRYTDSDPLVVIDYAHTPDALEKLLLSVRELRDEKGRIILIFGCGGERDRDKRRRMAQIASRLSDEVIVSSDNSRGEDPKQIFSDILKGIDKEKTYAVIEDRQRAIEEAVASAKHDDIIVLAGKGHENYEINANGKMPFDEKKIVTAALNKRRV